MRGSGHSATNGSCTKGSFRSAARRVGSVAGLMLVWMGCSDGRLGAGERRDGSAADAARLDVGDAAPADTGPSVPVDCPCFDGPGTYCDAEVAARSADAGCVVDGAAGAGARLWACGADGWSVAATCDAGCEQGESGAADGCALPECDCFVRVAWCGASAARHGLTLDPPCRVPLTAEHAEDILGCDAAGRWVVSQACPEGCEERPTGTPDACVSARTPAEPGWPACAPRALLTAGLHPEASDRLRCAGVTADRISQTIGNAAASAGYHAADGTADGRPYTAAVDLRTRDLSEAQIRALLDRLALHGFAAWYRKPGSDGWPSGEAPHIHAVFAGVVMKSQLRGQVRDFFAGLNGLASHTAYRFWRPTSASMEIVRLLFRRHYTP